MDIGAIAILQLSGLPRVVRCEPVGNGGVHFRAADNTAAFTGQMLETLTDLGVSPAQDGLYPCSKDVVQAAQFPALALPSDLITFSAAGRLLYPTVSSKTAWARISVLVNNARIPVYRVGLNPSSRYLSQADVLHLSAQHTGVAV